MFWLWIPVIVALFYFYNNGNFTKSESSLDILNKRFARGEIDDETYLKMKKTLGE